MAVIGTAMVAAFGMMAVASYGPALLAVIGTAMVAAFGMMAVADDAAGMSENGWWMAW